jgi:hypothetical protein
MSLDGVPLVFGRPPVPVSPGWARALRVVELRGRRQRAYVGEEGALVHDGLKGEELRHAKGVETARRAAKTEEQTGLAREAEDVRAGAVEEGTRVEAIADERHRAGARVMEDDREAAVQSSEGLRRILLVHGKPPAGSVGRRGLGEAGTAVEDGAHTAPVGVDGNQGRVDMMDSDDH